MRLFLQTIRLSIFSLLLHKLRSALAVLGILIGITAVIWLVAMGQGVSHQAQKQIEDLGARNIIVVGKKPSQEGSASASSGFYLMYGLLRDDYDRIATNLPPNVVEQIVPMREFAREIRRGGRSLEGRLVGCTPEYKQLNHLTIEMGRFIADRDSEPLPDNVCVIADEVAKVLFPYENPIGKTLQIDADVYVVVGQTSPRTASAAIGGSLSGQDYNKDVYIPLKTLFSRIGDQVMTSRSGSREGEVVELSQITLGVKNPDEETLDTADVIYEVEGVVKNLLRKYHPNADYEIIVPQELLEQAKLLEVMFNLLLILIAGISLVVGGIGIMNIMLATVTERTREIGIRRALGAKRIDIIQQFLCESVVLTGVGGLLGVGIGFLVGPTVTIVRNLLINYWEEVARTLPPTIMDLEPRIAWWSILLSLGISIFVGLVFGSYPAIRAAYMDPIEALRHE